MSWENRLRQMVMAGGVLFGGCSSQMLGPGNPGTGGSAPCGNGNPDPCICGRPTTSSEVAAQCQASMDCAASGGVWNPYNMGDSDGGVTPPHCEMDGGSVDGTALEDGGFDGNAAD